MSSPSLHRAVFSLCFAAGIAGCGGTLSTTGAGSVLPSRASAVHRAAGWMSPAAKAAKNLLYVANPFEATIDVFTLRGLKYTQVGQIGDSNAPDGMTTDAAGNLYVTDEGVATEGPVAGDIKVYPKGSTQYSRIIVPANWVPFDIAVGKDGTLNVANIAPIGSFSPGSVSIYPPNANQPSRVLRLQNFQVYGIALHAQTPTIYVSYEDSGSSGHIAAFRRARGKAVELGVSYAEPWGLLEDGNDNLLACDGAGTIDVYAESTGKLTSQISVPNGALWLAFNSDRSRLFATNFNDVQILSYPSGTLVGTIDESGWGKYDYPTGLAFWPPPR